MATAPPIIVRSIYDESKSPCVDPTNENYDMLLSYHKLGNSYTDSYIANILQAYLDHAGGSTKAVFATRSYNDMRFWSELNCENFIVEFELDDVGQLTIKKIPIDRKSKSRYSVSLIRALYRVLNDENEPKSKLLFEFTNGRVEYRIGTDTSKWYTDNAVLISLMVLDNSGGKRSLGVYDVSIPPDNR